MISKKEYSLQGFNQQYKRYLRVPKKNKVENQNVGANIETNTNTNTNTNANTDNNENN